MESLYVLNQKILACVKDGDNVVDTESGEVLDPSALDALQMEWDSKVHNLLCWVKENRASIKAIREKEIADAARRRNLERLNESIERYLGNVLQGRKFSDADCQASWRKSTVIDVLDPGKIPAKFLILQEPKIDKAGIKKELKTGAAVPGAVLETRNNLVIK